MTSPQVPEKLLTQEDTSEVTPSYSTAGQWLKAARQAKGVHLGVLAMTLKVPVRQLEALEADQYDAFKGGPSFLRAITSAMCRHLGVDAAPALALLPSPVSSMGAARPALDAVNRSARVSLRPSRVGSPSVRPVLVLAVLMLLVTAAFLWLPSPESWWPAAGNPEPAAAVVEESAVPLGQPANPDSTEDAVPSASAAIAAAASAPLAAALPAALPASTFAPAVAAPVASAPVVAPKAATVSSSPAVLRLEASADTWIDVRDAKGQATGKLLKAGDSLELSPPTPYSVVIGRAAAVKATLRGQPFDLKPHAPQSVARFEVKE